MLMRAVDPRSSVPRGTVEDDGHWPVPRGTVEDDGHWPVPRGTVEDDGHLPVPRRTVEDDGPSDSEALRDPALDGLERLGERRGVGAPRLRHVRAAAALPAHLGGHEVHEV